ncbi:MAG: amidohydrolase [Thermoplasmata archaeon]
MRIGFINCNVIPLAERKRRFHGFMVDKGRITSIDDFDRIMGKSEELINLQGYTILPGFIDSHTHLLGMGLDMGWVDLSSANTYTEAKYYLEKAVKNTPEDEWIIGTRYDDTKWKKEGAPNKEDLDEISNEHNILIKRICGHIAVVNSKALEKIDHTMDYVDTEMGVLKEEVLWTLDETIGINKKEKEEAIKRAIKAAHSMGVTCVHDIMDREAWELYQSIDEKNELNIRVRGYMMHDESQGLGPVEKSEYLALRGVKIFVDGSLGGRTAALEEDYEDDPGNRGVLLLEQNEIEDIIIDAEKRNFQLMAHAIGDRAISNLLSAYESISDRAKELRHRIEHAEMLSADKIRRIRDMGLVLSAQPNFVYLWSQKEGMNFRRLGEERVKKCDPFWDIQRSLVKMAFGSDCMPMSPIFGVFSAVNHPVLEQRISAYNALQSYIKNSAYAGKDEEHIGSLEKGKKADFVVLSEDPLESNDLRNIEVIMTVVNGDIVYDVREKKD